MTPYSREQRLCFVLYLACINISSGLLALISSVPHRAYKLAVKLQTSSKDQSRACVEHASDFAFLKLWVMIYRSVFLNRLILLLVMAAKAFTSIQ